MAASPRSDSDLGGCGGPPSAGDADMAAAGGKRKKTIRARPAVGQKQPQEEDLKPEFKLKVCLNLET